MFGSHFEVSACLTFMFQIRTLSDNISSTLKDGFKIQDVGTLALSWGE